MKQEILIGFRATTALAVGVLLAGCTANSGIIGASALDNAAIEEAALIQRFDAIFATDGATDRTELPAGTASYDGLVHGELGGGSGPDMEYFADLSLDANFDTDSVSGTVDNFRTDVPGFTAPSGSVAVAGLLPVAIGDATLNFTGNDDLTGSGRNANFDIDADGGFVGDAAEAAGGTHTTEFLWLTGPDTGDTSWSDGHWTVEQ